MVYLRNCARWPLKSMLAFPLHHKKDNFSFTSSNCCLLIPPVAHMWSFRGSLLCAMHLRSSIPFFRCSCIWFPRQSEWIIQKRQVVMWETWPALVIRRRTRRWPSLRTCGEEASSRGWPPWTPCCARWPPQPGGTTAKRCLVFVKRARSTTTIPTKAPTKEMGHIKQQKPQVADSHLSSFVWVCSCVLPAQILFWDCSRFLNCWWHTVALLFDYHNCPVVTPGWMGQIWCFLQLRNPWDWPRREK